MAQRTAAPEAGFTPPATWLQLLEKWFEAADNVTLACWDEGHHWDMGAKDSTHERHANSGMWATRERCHRRVDGVTCKVRRTRYTNPGNGRLDGPATLYDYSANLAYRLPKDPASGYSIINKDTRGRIRLERQRRASYGEEIA